MHQHTEPSGHTTLIKSDRLVFNTWHIWNLPFSLQLWSWFGNWSPLVSRQLTTRRREETGKRNKMAARLTRCSGIAQHNNTGSLVLTGSLQGNKHALTCQRCFPGTDIWGLVVLLSSDTTATTTIWGWEPTTGQSFTSWRIVVNKDSSA